MELIETLTYNNMEFFTEVGGQIGLVGDLNNFFEKTGLNRDDYEVRYFGDSDGRGSRKYFLNGIEVCSSFFGDSVLAQFGSMELKSKKLRGISFVRTIEGNRHIL